MDVKAKFAQDILPILVIFSLLFCDPNSAQSKITLL